MTSASVTLASKDVAHAYERIQTAEIHREPFPHLLIEGFFPEAFFRRLLNHFPAREYFRRVEYPGTGHDRSAKTYHDYGWACRNLSVHPVFSEVHDFFRSDAFSRSLLDKFRRQLPDGFWPIPVEKHQYFDDGATNFTSVFDLQIDLPGYEIPPHPDVPSKIVTYQFFLPDDDSLRDYGTLFCKPKAAAKRGPIANALGSLMTRAAYRIQGTQHPLYKRLERSALGLSLGIGDNRNWLPWSYVDVVKIAPAGSNCFMAFPPNAVSYHAVRFDVPPNAEKQERPVVRGFIRAGSNAQNWIQPKGM